MKEKAQIFNLLCLPSGTYSMFRRNAPRPARPRTFLEKLFFIKTPKPVPESFTFNGKLQITHHTPLHAEFQYTGTERSRPNFLLVFNKGELTFYSEAVITEHPKWSALSYSNAHPAREEASVLIDWIHTSMKEHLDKLPIQKTV